MVLSTQKGHKGAAVAALGLMVVAALAGRAAAEPVYGVTLQQFLVNWDSATPGDVRSGVAIQGLQANERALGLDFRPATGQLYALGSFSRLYTLNASTGRATPVGTGFSPALNGSDFGFDFNPVVDRIRVVSDADQNMRLHPDTGVVVGGAEDGMLAYGAGDPNFGTDANVVHAAYTNNVAGALSTTLFGIDTGLDVLVTQNPPNAGALNTVGGLGVDAVSFGGFDISGATGIAYAVVRDLDHTASTFWTINLTTGQGTMVGEIDGGAIVTAMTVVPEPATLALLAAGVLGIASRRRHKSEEWPWGDRLATNGRQPG